MAAEAARPGGPARAIARALAFVSLLACGSAQAFDLAELMGLMAHRPSGQARFTEQRYVKGFDAPLVASGTLEYQPPDRFTRRTLDPRAETMSVEGNTLTLTRAGRTRTWRSTRRPRPSSPSRRCAAPSPATPRRCNAGSA